MSTYVILGSGGVIGRNVAKSLAGDITILRLFSRIPVQVNPSDELMKGDLTNVSNVCDAVKGAEVAYLTAGLRYEAKVWKNEWPLIMKNVIEACKKENCKLVFFDNVYLYGRVNGKMTEESPVNPCSVKGQIRAEIAEMLMKEVRHGNITALIARAADFYGPDTPLSFVNVTVLDKLAKGKKPMWLINDKVKHSFTYTPDAGKATALLGNTESAYSQVWHLPTDPNALTGEQFIKLAASSYGAGNKYKVLSKGMVKFVGIFNKALKENNEMLYQNEFEYLFDSTKFVKAFEMEPTSYEAGIKATAESMKR
jgi:nucleoside-diphosphate-sugar epimerase